VIRVLDGDAGDQFVPGQEYAEGSLSRAAGTKQGDAQPVAREWRE